MRISLLKALPIFILFFLISPAVNAKSSLEVASDANFSSQTTEFGSGQTIYVRIQADNDGAIKHQLNLRDNQYNLLQSYTFAKTNENQFSISLIAPQDEGYYSLEAQIESAGANTTSVKTIKVGSPAGSSVRVNVKNNVNGQSATVNNSPSASPKVNSTPWAEPSISKDNQSDQNKDLLENPDITFGQSKSQGFFSQISQFFKNLWSHIWPF